ncbi:hypothetical protein PC128_g16210, partial [Phytophthora cactorum]
MLKHKRRLEAATIIQKCFRRFVAQRILAEMLMDKRKRASAIRIQANVRRWLAQRTLAGLRKQKLRVAAAICIEKNCRRWLAQLELARLRERQLQIVVAVPLQAQCRRLLAQRQREKLLRHKLVISTAVRIQTQCRRWLAQRKREQLMQQTRELAAASILQRHSRRWLEQNRSVSAKLQRFRLNVAFDKFRRACQAAGEMEAEPSPSDDSSASKAKCRMSKSIGLPVTQSSSEQDDSSTGDDRMDPPIRISAPTHRRTNSRQRSRANSRRSRTSSSHVDDRNSLLENEILRLQQMLVEQQNGSDVRPRRDERRRSSTIARPPRSAPLDLSQSARITRSRSGRRRYSVDGALSEDEDGENDDKVSLLPPRRARSVMPAQQADHVSMLSQKIEELDAKCKFLEQLVARKNYEDAARES